MTQGRFTEEQLDDARLYLLKATSDETGGVYLEWPLALCGVDPAEDTNGLTVDDHLLSTTNLTVATEMITEVIYHLLRKGYTLVTINEMLDDAWQTAEVPFQVVVVPRKRDLDE